MTSTTAPEAAPAVERQLAFDMVRRALPLLPVIVGIGAVARGGDGAASAAVGVAVVLANLCLAAAMLGWAARVGPNVLMATALGGFLVRMGLVVLAILAVRHQPWLDMPTLGFTIVATHLGLLAWETKYVAANLAFPALKPTRKGT